MQLQAGDLLVTGGAMHVGIVVRTEHGISMAHANTTGVVSITRLAPHQSMAHVFRCVDPKLQFPGGVQAFVNSSAALAAAWCKVNDKQGRLPYSTERSDFMHHDEQERKQRFKDEARSQFESLPIPEQTGDAYLDLLQKTWPKRQRALYFDFQRAGIYRAITYASRRAGDPIRKELGSSHNSFNCTLFAITCFQVAGIQHSVRELPAFVGTGANRPDPANWVSLKYSGLSVKDGDRHDVELFRRFRRTEYGYTNDHHKVSLRTGDSYLNPLNVWTGAKPIISTDFAALMTPAMCVDAKRCSVAELVFMMQQRQSGWTHIGGMQITGTAQQWVSQRSASEDLGEQLRSA